jgi:hypothetical protein
MSRRLVWLLPLLLFVWTCALNHEGNGNVIRESDAGDAGVDSSIGPSDSGIVLPQDALIGH